MWEFSCFKRSGRLGSRRVNRLLTSKIQPQNKERYRYVNSLVHLFPNIWGREIQVWWPDHIYVYLTATFEWWYGWVISLEVVRCDMWLREIRTDLQTYNPNDSRKSHWHSGTESCCKQKQRSRDSKFRVKKFSCYARGSKGHLKSLYTEELEKLK